MRLLVEIGGSVTEVDRLGNQGAVIAREYDTQRLNFGDLARRSRNPDSCVMTACRPTSRRD